MTYTSLLTTAKAAAFVAAGIAAFGTAIGLHAASPNAGWLIPALVGIGLAALLAAGWHVVLHGAAYSRHGKGITASIVGGLLLAAIALGASGWTLATAIGGSAAQGIYHQQALQQHEAALVIAYERVQAQQAIVEQLALTATAYTGFAESEERGDFGAPGCGPACRDYQRVGANMQSLGRDLRGVLDDAKETFELGQQAVAIGRSAISADDPETFGIAMAAIASAVSELNAVDVSTRATGGGMVEWEQANGGPTAANRDNLTEAVHDVAEAAVLDPVPVPVFAPMTRGEAVITYRDRVPGAWIVAAAVDLSPLVLLLLVMAYAREPLLRQMEARVVATDNEVMRRELTLVGKGT
jgi:hypothetical protein